MNQTITRAVLTVSFGTSVKETRVKTIESIEHAIRSQYPDCIHERAWTSRILRNKVLESEGLHIPSIQEALTKLKSNNISEVYIQPTFVTDGGEYQKLIQEVTKFQDQFSLLRIGAPLMKSEEDLAPLVAAITQSSAYPHSQSDEILLFIGHGTTSGEDFLYDQLNKALQTCGTPNLFLKTMNSLSAIEDIISIARKRRIKTITIAPFMIVAGRHALHDLASDHPDSWKSTLKQAGFTVHCNMTGLGEIPEIQQLFLHRLAKTGIND